MDSYFLTKDDFDAILELGVGPMDQEKVKIETQAKATFTRLYVLATAVTNVHTDVSTDTTSSPILCHS